ncbi:S1 RNA-binding domain-containing protein, partial [Staphylococcus pseudintermedius]|nr:S1 RNA-binding domain-containing protein [Staphylococcus pseudintermedius]
KVKVRSVEQDSERVSLSIKDTLPSPFETIQEKYSEGDIVEGKVMRLASFGAFVEIGSGLQGLVHISEISHKHIGTPGEVLEPGQTVQVKILGINPEEERISLSIKAANPDEETEEASEETTQHYTQPADENENNPTLGDVFGDKLKDLNL